MPAKGTPLRNAGSGRNGIRMTSDTLTPGLVGFPPKLNAAIGATMHFYAPQVQSHARDICRAPAENQRGPVSECRRSFECHSDHCRHYEEEFP